MKANNKTHGRSIHQNIKTKTPQKKLPSPINSIGSKTTATPKNPKPKTVPFSKLSYPLTMPMATSY